MSTANQFEDRARQAKCERLAVHIWAHAVRVAEEATDAEWAHWASGAGVNPPSKQSQQVIIEILKRGLKI